MSDTDIYACWEHAGDVLESLKEDDVLGAIVVFLAHPQRHWCNAVRCDAPAGLRFTPQTGAVKP